MTEEKKFDMCENNKISGAEFGDFGMMSVNTCLIGIKVFGKPIIFVVNENAIRNSVGVCISEDIIVLRVHPTFTQLSYEDMAMHMSEVLGDLMNKLSKE